MSTCTPFTIPAPVDYGTSVSAGPAETAYSLPATNPAISYEIISTNACGDELRKETTLTYSLRTAPSTALIGLNEIFDTYATLTGISAHATNGIACGYGDVTNGDTTHAFLYDIATATFTDLGTLVGGSNYRARFISDDGTKVAGFYYAFAGILRTFWWSEATGMIDCGVPEGMENNSPASMSNDGNALAINSNIYCGVWTHGVGLTVILPLSGDVYSRASCINSDGSVVGCGSVSESNVVTAFAWNAVSGTVALGDGSLEAEVYNISRDALVMTGAYNHLGTGEMFIWQESTGIVVIDNLPSWSSNGGSTGISADGSIIASTGQGDAGQNAAIYQSGAWTELSKLPSGTETACYIDYGSPLNSAGTLAVGWASNGDDNQSAVMWDTSTSDITDIGIPSGTYAKSAGISTNSTPSGFTVIGNDDSGRGFIYTSIYYLDAHTTDRHYQINPREVAQAEHERRTGLIFTLRLDWCENVYGVSPCTAIGAAGSECYNTYGTCQDTANFTRTTKDYDFCKRGQFIPPGMEIRPYITDTKIPASTTEIPIGGGLAVRSMHTYTLTDEVCSDVGLDPYWATRATPATSTFWTRLLARNYNMASRPVLRNTGYLVLPFDESNWTNTWQEELYRIESVKGLSSNGTVQITISDVSRVLDKTLWPVPTTGTLQADLKAYEHVGYVTPVDSTHVILESEASAVDDAYVGMEFYISQYTGSGQRKKITAYVGATREATLNTALAVLPDTTSIYEVSALSINVGTGNGTQYTNPATRMFNPAMFNNAMFNVAVTTAEPLYVAIGKEVIRCTRRVGDVLSWSSSEYRGQFGTSRSDHDAADVVQQCGVAIEKSVTDTINMLTTSAGLPDGNVDLAGLAIEDANWLGNACLITACFPTPTKTGQRLHELLVDTMLNAWWNPVLQKLQFKADMPEFGGTIKAITPDETISNSMSIEQKDELRITRYATSYAPLSATGTMAAWSDFHYTAQYVDVGAESVNEYGDKIEKTQLSQWLSEGNSVHAYAKGLRTVKLLRDAPKIAQFKLDPRDEVSMAQLIDVTSRNLTDATGTPLTKRMRVIKLQNSLSEFDVRAISTPYSGREAFIAPDGTADYPTNTTYAHISEATGLMSDGSAGYTII